MSLPISAVPAQYASLYQSTLAQAAQAGESIMANVLAAARQSLKERVSLARGFVERDHLELTVKLLDCHARSLCDNYPQALRAAFKALSPAVRDGETDGRPVDRMALLASVNFDQLELMASAEVHERVASARLQQSVLLAADTALSELNPYICATLGMQTVQPERNPLRPDVYVRALQRLVAETQAPSLVQLDWLQHMGGALGKALSQLYSSLSDQFRSQGVKAAGYAAVRSFAAMGRPVNQGSASISQAPISSASPRSVASVPRDQEATVLTLDRLRQLLIGELDTSPLDAGVAKFAAQFAREFESAAAEAEPPSTDFQSTVPAALEALQEMQQVDHLVERLGKRRHATPAGDAGQSMGQRAHAALRDKLRRSSGGLGQALSLEVVSLMVDNMARDTRLLDPIKEVIKNLEPALLKLALVDPRFFSHKQHPARRLLEEITQRSLAFENPDSPGFAGFLQPLNSTVGALTAIQIEDAGAFELALQALVQVWDAHAQQQQKKLELAVEALQQAEQRSLLADIVATEIRLKPAAVNVDADVLAFVCGPWAQVIAHAQMADQSGTPDPGQYRELVTPLLWSAQPALTRANVAKLTRLVPKLLAKLREGLHLIGYPSLKTSVFFELLMNLQQQAFRPQATSVQTPKVSALHPSLLLADDPWVAPEEAKASGFMALPDDDEVTQAPSLKENPASLELDTIQLGPVIDTPVILTAEVNLPVGAWVEMLVKDVWVRTQLSWASPHGTLFLFTSAYGTTQSMSKRSRDKLIATGTMRVVSGQPVVQGALDAVVQAAMLNSLDVKP
jgi:hypothetical protein